MRRLRVSREGPGAHWKGVWALGTKEETESLRKGRRRQLRWQCRRGMRELDTLLSGYLEQRYADSSDAPALSDSP